MRVFFAALLIVFALVNRSNAQQASLLPAAPSQYRQDAPPKRVSPRFWTPLTTGLVFTDGAAKAVDAYFTRYNIDHHGKEYDPLLRPFVQKPALHAGAVATLFAAEIATAYLMHRKGRTRFAHALLLGGIALNGMGAQQSIRHRGN